MPSPNTSAHKLRRLWDYETPFWWDDMEPLVAKACARTSGRLTALDVYDLLCRGIFHAWVILDRDGKVKGCCVVEIVNYPSRKAGHLVVLSGEDAKEWLHFEVDVTEWCRQRGATIMQAFARPGWERLTDWSKRAVLLEKDIPDAPSSREPDL